MELDWDPDIFEQGLAAVCRASAVVKNVTPSVTVSHISSNASSHTELHYVPGPAGRVSD